MRSRGRSVVSLGIPFLVVALAALLALASGGRSGGGPPADQPGTPAAPGQPGKKGERRLEVPGQVEAFEQARLHARLTGTVRQVAVELGDRVRQGQVLAELDVPEVEAERQQKEALAAQAEAGVEQARRNVQAAEAAVAAVEAQVRAAEAGARRAQAEADRARAEYERLRKLDGEKAVEGHVVEEKAGQAEAARAAVEEAGFRVKAGEATREGSVAQRAAAQAGVKAAEAQAQAARAEVQRLTAALAGARVVAPFDGVVTGRAVAPGDLIGLEGDGGAGPLFVVARVDRVRVVLAVPEAVAPRVRAGAEARVRVVALPGQEFEGKVARTAGSLDPGTRTLRAEIDLPNPDGKLLPGLHVTAALVVEGD
jgi:multidrug efflux pump subunit AcrA (membrane-fusion protein)